MNVGATMYVCKVRRTPLAGFYVPTLLNSEGVQKTKLKEGWKMATALTNINRS